MIDKTKQGENMIQPVTFSEERSQQEWMQQKAKFQRMRDRALALTKFGMGWPGDGRQNEVDKLGNELVSMLADWSQAIKSNPRKYNETLSETLDGLNSRYSNGFNMIVMPGCGNFEGYIGTGGATGASADGRLASQSYASDCSAAPIPSDLEAIPQNYGTPLTKIPNPQYNRMFHNLYSWNNDAFTKKLSNVAPCDTSLAPLSIRIYIYIFTLFLIWINIVCV